MTTDKDTPVTATESHVPVQQSTEANTTIQYQWSPVSAMAANGTNRNGFTEPHNQSVGILGR